MMQDPSLSSPAVQLVFSDRLAPLWTSALQRPDLELRRLAADTIALADSYGMSGLGSMEDQLVAVLQSDQQDITVRRAAANALVKLDTKRAADLLAKQSEEANPDIALIVEPALGRWGYEPIRTTWLARLDNPATERLRLRLAIEGLKAKRESQALPGLLRIAENASAAPSLRLAAARAAAVIDPSGLAEVAEIALTHEFMLDRLIGCALIEYHSDPKAIDLLKTCARDESAVVAAVALRRLLAIDPTLAHEFAATAIVSKDVNVRTLGAQAVAASANIESVQQLSPLLNDPNPNLRRYVAQSLLAFAGDPGLREAVIDACMQTLSGDQWRGLPESAIVLAELEHKPAAPRMLELLQHQRPPVAVAAAWSLRRLRDASLLGALDDFAQQRGREIIAGQTAPNRVAVVDFQLGQIFQAFGEHRYDGAAPLLRQFIPKKLKPLDEARSASMWTLGKLYQDQSPEDLTDALLSRLSDTSVADPESRRVRRMCAISVGRMKSDHAVTTLYEMAEYESGTLIAVACNWGIEKITGKKEETPRRKKQLTDWFLAPK
jgi:HEAT repeat protein